MSIFATHYLHHTTKAATEEAGRIRADGEQAVQDIAAGAKSPAAANKQPATSIVAEAHGHPRAAPSPAVLAAGGSPMNQYPETDVTYSGESDYSSDTKPYAKPDRKVAGSTTAAPRGSLQMDLSNHIFVSSD